MLTQNINGRKVITRAGVPSGIPAPVFVARRYTIIRSCFNLAGYFLCFIVMPMSIVLIIGFGISDYPMESSHVVNMLFCHCSNKTYGVRSKVPRESLYLRKCMTVIDRLAIKT